MGGREEEALLTHLPSSGRGHLPGRGLPFLSLCLPHCSLFQRLLHDGWFLGLYLPTTACRARLCAPSFERCRRRLPSHYQTRGARLRLLLPLPPLTRPCRTCRDGHWRAENGLWHLHSDARLRRDTSRLPLVLLLTTLTRASLGGTHCRRTCHLQTPETTLHPPGAHLPPSGRAARYYALG